VLKPHDTWIFLTVRNALKTNPALVWLFGLAVLAVLVVNNLLIASVVILSPTPARDRHSGILIFWARRWFIRCTSEIDFTSANHRRDSFGTCFQLPWAVTTKSSSSPQVARQLQNCSAGAHRIRHLPMPDEQRLRNVIEEMAVASEHPCRKLHP